MADVPEVVWRLLSEAVLGRSALSLRSESIRAALVSVAYISGRTLKAAKAGVWNLASGDVKAKLTTLAAQPEMPHDDTVAKIWRLLRAGFGLRELEQALALVRDLPWSAASVEQQHGSASTIMKYHDRLGRSSMMSRALLHAMRQFFEPDADAQAVSSLQRKVDSQRAKRRRVSYLTGREMFLQDLMATACELMAWARL